MKKTILFSAICLLMATGASACPDGQEKRMRVTQPSGHTYTLALEPGLCIHLEKADQGNGSLYPGRKYIVVVNAQQDTLYTVADAAMLSYIGEFPAPPTGVEQVEGEAGVRLQEDGISVSGCPDKTVVSVYSVDGKQYVSATVQDGTCFIPRSDLPKGVLVIKMNNKAIKLINR